MGRLLVGVLLAALALPGAASAAESPETDPFYVAPPGLAQAEPGEILRTRDVQVSLAGLPAELIAGAHQLLFRTNDAHGRAVTGVTTVIVPKGEPPAGGRNLVSLQNATNASDLTCAPSYQLQIGSRDNKNLLGHESAMALTSLTMGATVVIPDHLGPRSQYLVKKIEGHTTLDGIRAAERSPAAQLGGTSTQVGLIGYSGGGHATAAAGELQPAYAPELNLVAVAAGGVPPGNRATFESIDGGIGTGVLLGVSIALDSAFPKFGLAELLNEKGKAFVEKHKKGCASSVFAAPFARFDDFTKAPGAIDLPQVGRVLERNTLGRATPTAPTFFYNAIGDELVKIEPLDALVDRYCAGGATLRYVRDPAGLEHIQAAVNFIALAEPYLADRFAGRAVPSDCGPADPPAAAPCTRTVRLRVRIPDGVRVKRIVVRSRGRVVARLHRRATRIRVRLVGPTARVSVRIVGQRQRLTRRRTVRVC